MDFVKALALDDRCLPTVNLLSPEYLDFCYSDVILCLAVLKVKFYLITDTHVGEFKSEHLHLK